MAARAWVAAGIERGGQLGRRPVSVGRRARERPGDGLVHLGRNLAQGADARRRSAEPLGEDRLLSRAGEGRLAGQHLVEHAAEGVHVGAAVERALAGRLLGAHVVRRPEHDAGLGEPRRRRPATLNAAAMPKSATSA